jgi:hypothetical protein
MISLIPTVHAASKAQISAQCFVDKINDAILFPLIALMMALAFLFFLYGAFEYVRNAANEAGRETGRRHLMYGVIGMMVMLSALALLKIAAGTFGLGLPTVDCSQFSDEENSAISTSPTFGTQPFDSDGYVNLPSAGGRAPDPSINIGNLAPLPDVAPSVDIAPEPYSLLNPNPTPGADVIDVVSPNPQYPVIDTWDNGSRVISCGGEVTCSGAVQSCVNDHMGVYSGARGGNRDDGYIVCNP